MKFSQTTCVAILASLACANTMPQAPISNNLVARSDALQVLDILAELQSLVHQKKELGPDHPDYAILEARATSSLGDFITALSSSGLIGDIWNIITTDSALQTEVVGLIKSAVTGLIAQAPALLSAIWNSGLLQDIFNAFVNDAALRDSFLGVLSSIVDTAIGLLTGGSGSTGSTGTTAATTTTTAAAAPATSAAAKREYTQVDISKIKRELNIELNSQGEFLDKRDLLSTVVSVVEAIYNSGLVQSLISKALADPAATVSFLTSALQTGLVVVEDIYSWAKSSGILDSILSSLEANGSTYLSDIVSFLSSLFGGASSSTPATSGTTAAVSAAATSTTAAGLFAAPATTTTAAGIYAPATTVAAAGTAATNAGSNAILSSLAAVYGGSTPTTLVKRMNY